MAPPQARPPSAGRRASSERQSTLSSSHNPAPSVYSHLKSRSQDDGGVIGFMLQTLYQKLPTTHYRPLVVLSRDPSFVRPLDAIKTLAATKPNDVLRPLLAQASQAGRELPFLARDDLSFSAAHQAYLFLLELIHHVLPAPPTCPGEVDDVAPSELDGRTADRLIALAAGVLGQTLPTSGSRQSEDSSIRGSAAPPPKGIQRKPKRHEHTPSRSGALSPSVSSLSIGGGSTSTGAREPSTAHSSRRTPAHSLASTPFSTLTFDIHATITDAASAIVYALSYHRWDAFFGTVRARAQHLASESNIALNPSAADLVEFKTLGACFVDRARLNQVVQELSSVFLHIPRIAQAVLAEAVYENVWAFIRFAPDDFVDLHLGAALQGDLGSLFDMAWNSCRDLGVMAPRWAKSFWPVMALWMSLSPGLCGKVVAREGDNRGQIKGSAGKKIAWFDSLQSSFYLPNFSQVAKRCCIDLIYLSTLLPPGDDFSLKHLVSDFAVELQEQLLYGEDDHRDIETLSFGIYSLVRRNPRDVLLSSLPGLRTTMVDWQKYTIAKALLMLQKEMPEVFFDGDPLFADVGAVLREFVRELQPDPTTPNSLLPHDKIAILSALDLELLQIALEFFSRDVRFLIPSGSSQLSTDVELGGILASLASILSAPVPGDLKTSSAACLTTVYETVATVELEQGGEDVWRVLGNAAWTPLWHAGLPIIKPSLSEDTSLMTSFHILSDMFDLACKYSARFSWYLASRSAVVDGLDMHEAISVYLGLSSDRALAAAGLRSLDKRTPRIKSILFAMSEDERDAPLGRELRRLSAVWRGEADDGGSDGLRTQLHSLAQPPQPRTAEIVLEAVFQRWLAAGQDMDIMPFESPEVDEWRHTTRFVGSYLAPLLAGEAFCLPSGSSADLTREFVGGMIGFLRHPDAQIRSSVEEALGQLHPSLAPAVIRSLHDASLALFDRDRSPLKNAASLDLVASATGALAALLAKVDASLRSPSAAPPTPVTAVCVDFIDFLASTSADRSAHARPPVSMQASSSFVRTLAHACRMLGACLHARDSLGLSADEQRLLASYVLDSISSWTSVTLTGFSDPNLLPELEALDEACLNATISAAQVVSLVDEHRASRSRAHLVQTWTDISLALAETESPAAKGEPSLLVRFLSTLLRSNGDVVLAPLLTAARAEVPAHRAVALAVLGSALEPGSWLDESARLSLPMPVPPLLKLLNGQHGVSLSPSILYHISGSSTDNDALAELLLRQAEANGKLFSMLEILCQVEVANTSGEADIFRGATLTTKVFTLLAKRHALNYLRTILQPFILAVCEGHPSRFENESRSSSSSDSPNSRSIEILAQTCFDRICDSIDEAPPILKEACRILGESFEKRFKGLRRRAVSSFVILRVVSPAMISPASIYISHPNLSGGGRRALVEVSKLLVHLANDASLGKAVDTDEYANFLTQENLGRTVAYLDGLQVSSAPVVLVPPSASDDSADELFLRLYLSSNLAALQSAPKGSLLEDKIAAILASLTPRSTMTLGRTFSPDHLSSSGRLRTSIAFMKRCSTLPPPPFDLVHDISVHGKNIFSVDFGGAFALDFDTVLYAGLLTLNDTLGPFTLVLDCTSLPATSSATQANLTNWIFAAVQVLPSEIAALCRKIVLWSPNSWTVKTFRRVHALLSMTDNQRLLDAVVACSGVAALAHHLEVPEEDILLPSLSVDEDPVFSDDEVEVVDAHGQQRPVKLSLDNLSLVLRHLKPESLHSQHGHAQVAVKDVYGLLGLQRVEHVRHPDRAPILRLHFEHDLVLDLVLRDSSDLEKHLLSSATTSAPGPLEPDQICVRLFILGLSNLSSRHDLVRANAHRLLDHLVGTKRIACPDLPALEGFHLPAAIHEEIAILVEQAARCNPHLAPLFLQELCAAVRTAHPSDPDTLLALLLPFLRATAASTTLAVSPAERRLSETVARDLIGMTLGLAASRPLGEIVLHIWETVGKLDPLLADLALEDLLSRAVVGTSDDVAVIGEVLSVVSTAGALASALGSFRQVQTVSEPSNRGPTEATLSAAHSRLLRLLVKLSYSRRHPSHLAISLPELLVACLRPFAVRELEEVDAALAIVANAFHSLSEPTGFPLVQSILSRLAMDVRSSALRSADGPSPVAMSDHLERACRSLQKLVRAVAPNEDQYNVWVSRWTGLAAGTMASEDETAAAASLASLTVLLGDRPSEVDFLLHTLALLAKELEQAHRPHHVVGLIRVLDAMVKNLSVESALSMFWVGLGVTKIGSLYFSVGVRLVASALTTLLQGRTLPSPAGLCAFLELPRCAFMVDHLEDDWGVRFGGDGSFALGLLAMLFKGLLSPATLDATRDALLLVLTLLLQCKQIQPAEELCFLVALSVVDGGLERCKEVYASAGRPFDEPDRFQLSEGKLSVACLAFVAGPRLDAADTDKQRTLPLAILAKASESAPSSLAVCHDLLLAQLEQTFALSADDRVLQLAAVVYPFAAASTGNTLDRLLRTLSAVGLPYLHMCHETAEPRKEAVRRLSFVASVLISAEAARLFEADEQA